MAQTIMLIFISLILVVKLDLSRRWYVMLFITSTLSLGISGKLLDMDHKYLRSIQSDLSSIQESSDSIESDVSSIESDVSSIKSDVSSIKSDVSSIEITVGVYLPSISSK
jgi:peptidoglycan hydrolase CwlO-like protein